MEAYLTDIIKIALQEDIKDGDITIKAISNQEPKQIVLKPSIFLSM